MFAVINVDAGYLKIIHSKTMKTFKKKFTAPALIYDVIEITLKRPGLRLCEKVLTRFM